MYISGSSFFSSEVSFAWLCPKKQYLSNQVVLLYNSTRLRKLIWFSLTYKKNLQYKKHVPLQLHHLQSNHIPTARHVLRCHVSICFCIASPSRLGTVVLVPLHPSHVGVLVAWLLLVPIVRNLIWRKKYIIEKKKKLKLSYPLTFNKECIIAAYLLSCHLPCRVKKSVNLFTPHAIPETLS